MLSYVEAREIEIPRAGSNDIDVCSTGNGPSPSCSQAGNRVSGVHKHAAGIERIDVGH